MRAGQLLPWIKGCLLRGDLRTTQAGEQACERLKRLAQMHLRHQQGWLQVQARLSAALAKRATRSDLLKLVSTPMVIYEDADPQDEESADSAEESADSAEEIEAENESSENGGESDATDDE